MTAGNKEPCGGLAPRCCPTDFLDAHTCLKFTNSTSIRVGTLGDREEAISFGFQMPNEGTTHTIVSFVSSTGVQQHEDG